MQFCPRTGNPSPLPVPPGTPWSTLLRMGSDPSVRFRAWPPRAGSPSCCLALGMEAPGCPLFQGGGGARSAPPPAGCSQSPGGEKHPVLSAMPHTTRGLCAQTPVPPSAT